MSDHKHEWYVDGSHESNITPKRGWADLGLICISDDDCDDIASVMIDIDYNKIIEEKDN